ncbi:MULTISPECIES: NAD(P)(+) transhydrogenase (Re/Si-specific) subunit beta [Caulobacter]|uniref:NAD(P) transhydrogenase subunit beta n=2 Tax=Caulobacter vibrioides TaxID=155892 RepID=Q9A3A1_CAUVC|nr:MULTISPECIES: NAD(P)(+) transhydrogenase (Re/Si-specific) subunit beta [Caulobacter]YP_002518785.1 NAD(P)(+) transhydrogenase (Re/Si-specific) subunit beta [Caulobacter vibrioides NA1000]AAK25265.1 NAD(P) transhydrogenase, beta subunit [Caulobacter vibrioides CB15]ACL96877.1 NAD(P)(+) transhydrogenase (Re/Si-specific) subunit beta [Caulobacter vibrioides NA1000]ATC30129.1 NAD(P)(+) transhydrogenase (Re/Si-specific) subunit beta [Caulobacter vibrioides]MCY1645611.1 NAD(P)(+) transhydrogenase
MNANLAAILYLVSGVLFILALRGLSSPVTSQTGNRNGMIGMAIAVGTTLATLWSQGALDAVTLGLILGGVAVGGAVGAVIARRVAMTSMPQLVAAFHSLVGMAACLVAVAAIYTPAAYGIVGEDGAIHGASLIELSLGLAIGAITFTGSVIAFAKLNGNMGGAPILLPARHLLNIIIAVAIVALIVVLVASGGSAIWAFWGIFALSLLIGVTLIIPIGGADMPVVVSMLNSYSGWAAAALGFTLENTTLIITGALVGSSGAILSYIMCKGMNRSFVSVILGGFGADAAAAGPGGKVETRPVKQGSADDAAFIMKNASKVIIVPGYGMAVSQAQHALREMADKLKEEGVEVKYAIHPVAGRMPGHMNVLLAEANVPYDEVFELEDINSEFSTADVAFVIGANDVTNPAAKTDPTSAIFGMPILDVEKARTVLFVKRGMASGYAGVENELFFRDNTMMLFGDAKKMVEGILKGL